MDTKEIRTLIDLMKKNGLAVFKMEKECFKITLKTAGAAGSSQFVTSQPIVQWSETPSMSSTALEAPASSGAPASTGPEIKSPMVGTYYAASSPDAAPFVSVGQAVTPDTVICIIEAMKVMNEVKAEVSGVIAEICAENGKPVQFGQALFRLK